MFSKICANSWELFQLGPGDWFHCQVSEEGFRELQHYLLDIPLTPYVPPVRAPAKDEGEEEDEEEPPRTAKAGKGKGGGGDGDWTTISMIALVNERVSACVW